MSAEHSTRDVDEEGRQVSRTPEYQERMKALAGEPLVDTDGRGRGLVGQVRRILSYRELLDLLIRRELKVRYKDSFFGFAWTLIRPLTMLIVYYVAVGIFLGASRNIPDFPIYLFAGLTLWMLFSEILSTTTSSIMANAGLVKKVDLPLEVFPLASVGSALFNFAVQCVVLIAGTVVMGKFPTGDRWLFFPIAVAVAVVWGLGIGFILSGLMVYLRDVQYLVEIALTVGFWLSPIVYLFGMVRDATGGHPWVEQIYLANPVTASIIGFHQTFWVAGDTTPNNVVPENLGLRLLVMLVLGLVFVLAGQRIFQRLSGNFAQEL